MTLFNPNPEEILRRVREVVDSVYPKIRPWLDANGFKSPTPERVAELITNLIRSDLEKNNDLLNETINGLSEELGLIGKPADKAQQALSQIIQLAALAYIKVLVGLGWPYSPFTNPP